ncbi:MAG: PAS domain S-box protein [Acidimicrobiia bacterium]|nr:PAS domain S-box protein [Acidimicrobiia bacterium]
MTERVASAEDLELFDHMWEDSPDLLAVASFEGYLVRVNPSFERVLGWSPDTWAQHPFVDFIHPDDVERTLATWTEAKATGETVIAFENRYRCYDGSYKWLQWNGVVVAELGRTFNVAREITSAKLHETLERATLNIRAVLDTVGDAVITYDTHGTIVGFNRAAEELYGYSERDMMGQDVRSLVPPAHREDYETILHDIVREQAIHPVGPSPYRHAHEYEGLLRSGDTIAVEATVGFTPGPDPLFTAVIRDIRERREAEERVEQSLFQLVDSLVTAVETRDPHTAGHQRRVAEITTAICEELGLDPQRAQGVHLAALIHDLGKLYVPAEILSRPGSLTESEWGMVKYHPIAGADIVARVEFDWPVRHVVRGHHERLDGSGYPDGLAGDEIDLETRIVTVADVLEAMTAHRPYRPGRPVQSAIEELTRGRGRLYDPDVVDATIRLLHGTARSEARAHFPPIPSHT